MKKETEKTLISLWLLWMTLTGAVWMLSGYLGDDAGQFRDGLIFSVILILRKPL
jgi:hypothetical protein